MHNESYTGWSWKYNFGVHQCAQTEMWVLFWPLNRVIKLTEINNALWVNSQELGVYRAHNLTQQQSIFWKGHGTLKSVETTHMLLFFPDTVVSHIFLPILQGIIPQRPWKHISGPFSILVITVIVAQRRVCSVIWIRVVKLKLDRQHGKNISTPWRQKSIRHILEDVFFFSLINVLP